MTTELTFPCIVVERPHQRPAKAWIAYRAEEITAAAGKPDLSDALELLGDDLHALTILESASETRDYYADRTHGLHNKGYGQVANCAVTLGWLTRCPACSLVNIQADEDGAVDGPREYHATCWANLPENERQAITEGF